MAEKSSLDEALARIVGAPPPGAVPSRPGASATSYYAPQTSVALSAAADNPDLAFPQTQIDVSNNAVAADLVGQAATPTPTPSPYDTMLAAKNRYLSATEAAKASIPAGAIPVVSHYETPSIEQQREARKTPTTYYTPGFTLSSSSYTNSVMPMDISLRNAMDVARTDYEKAMLAYNPSFKAAPAPFYGTAEEMAKSSGSAGMAAQQAAGLAGMRAQASAAGMAPTPDIEPVGTVHNWYNPAGAPLTGREFMAAIGKTRSEFQSMARPERQALRAQYGRV